MKKNILYILIATILVACNGDTDKKIPESSTKKNIQESQKEAATPHFKAEPLPPEKKYKTPKL